MAQIGDIVRRMFNVAASVPDIRTPFSSLANASVTRDGIGILYKLGATVSAGGTLTIPHNLGRIPNRAQVLFNPGAYAGDCFLSSATATACVVQVENAQGIGSVIRVV